MINCDTWTPTNEPDVTAPACAANTSRSSSLGLDQGLNNHPYTSKSASGLGKTIMHGKGRASRRKAGEPAPNVSIPQSDPANDAGTDGLNDTTEITIPPTTENPISLFSAADAICKTTDGLPSSKSSLCETSLE